MNALGIVLFVVALLVSIILHEAGHMVCARWSGGKVTEFFVGFGPRLWSFKRGHTEYGVKPLPAGAYVKIVGMTDLEPVEPEDEPYVLYRKPTYKRLLTMAAGSLTHFLIALLIFLLVPFAFGEYKPNNTATIGAIEPCISQQVGNCDPHSSPPSPARKAGLRAGDRIVAVDGHSVGDWNQLTAAMHGVHPGTPTTLTILRDGHRQAVTLTPVVGNVSTNPNTVVKGTMVGIQGPNPYHVYPGPVKGLSDGIYNYGQSFTSSLEGLGSIPASIPKLFSATVHHSQRSDTSVTGIVGAANIGGQIFGDRDFAGFLMIIGALNTFIGIFNLLPILPLDGGHIAVLLYESGRRRVFRLLRRPEPGRVDLNKLLPAAYTFLIVVAGLMVLLLAADITDPIRLPS